MTTKRLQGISVYGVRCYIYKFWMVWNERKVRLRLISEVFSKVLTNYDLQMPILLPMWLVAREGPAENPAYKVALPETLAI